MANKFLDSTGLSHFWEKIKAAIKAATPDASTTTKGLVKLSTSTSSTSTTTAATSSAVKSAYDRAGTVLRRTIYTTGKITFPNPGYVKLTDMSTLGLSASDDYIVGINIRGWRDGSGALSVAKGSDGTTIYGFCSAAASFTSVTLEIWYTKMVPY